MTEKQALTAMRKVFGKRAAVEKRPRPTTSPSTGAVLTGTHRVGHIAMGMFFHVEGSGMTWSEAVEDMRRKRRSRGLSQ